MPSRCLVLQDCSGRIRRSGRFGWLGPRVLVGIFFRGRLAGPRAVHRADHPSWASRFQEVELVRDVTDLKISCRNLWAYLFACESTASFTARRFPTVLRWLAVIDCKVRAKKIRAVQISNQLWLSFDVSPLININISPHLRLKVKTINGVPQLSNISITALRYFFGVERYYIFSMGTVPIPPSR